MKYQDLEKKITTLQTEIAAKEKQLSQAKDRTDRAEAEIDGLFEAFRRQMLAGKETKIAEVESAIDNAHKEMNRDKVLVAGLEEALPKLHEELDSLTAERNQFLGSLAEKWLKREIGRFDEAVSAVLKSKARLLKCFNILRETGEGERYREALGDAYSYLPGVTLSPIRNFRRDIHVEGDRSFTRDDVLSEITKG